MRMRPNYEQATRIYSILAPTHHKACECGYTATIELAVRHNRTDLCAWLAVPSWVDKWLDAKSQLCCCDAQMNAQMQLNDC